MAFWNRKSDPEIPVDETSYKAWKADDGGGVRWHSALSNEQAGAKSMAKSYAVDPPSAREVAANAAAGHRWVAEEAERLYDGRGTRGRRSVQFDGHGRGRVPLFSIGGIWSAPQDRERWPGETQPGRGRGGGCTIPGCTCGQ